MTYLVVCDVKEAEPFLKRSTREQLLNIIPEDVFEYCEKTKSESLRKTRFAAYISLYAAQSELLLDNGKPSIERENLGKPFFKNSKISFSLSHTEGAALVAISDSCFNIGVDIEGKIEEEKANRLEKRFLKEVDVDSVLPFFELYEVSFEKASPFLKRKDAPKSSKNCVEKKWVICEAALKSEGGGFSSYKELKKILNGMEISAVELDINNVRYYAAVAKNKKTTVL